MKPTDLVIVRDALLRWYDNPLSLAEERLHFDDVAARDPRIGQFYDFRSSHIAKRQRIRSAALFFVSPDMTDLAVASGASVPPFRLHPSDLPAEAGLIMFAKPIGSVFVREVPEAHHKVMGATWSFSGGFGKALSMTFLSDLRATRDEIDRLGTRPDLVRQWETYPGPNVGRCAEVDIPSEDDDDETLTAYFADLYDYVRATLAALLLLNQPGMATMRPYAFDRLDRANLRRRRIDPQPVRVIQLRHATTPAASPTSEQREYQHRWVVRGHWRQQPYGPGRAERRPVWITPHVKGPEGAPLLTGEKVYAWVR